MTQRPTSGRSAGADQTVTAAEHVDLDDVLGRAVARVAGATGVPAAAGTAVDGAIDRVAGDPAAITALEAILRSHLVDGVTTGSGPASEQPSSGAWTAATFGS